MTLKALHISFRDWEGGAARAAFRLHKGLVRLGERSAFFVLHRCTNEPTVTAFTPSRTMSRRLRRRFRRELISRQFALYRASRPMGLELFSDDRSEFADDMESQIPSADVINLHWVAGFLNYHSFFSRLPERTPVVWTLHDMSAFTGGCHYDNGCGKFHTQCGACPQLGSTVTRDLAYRIWLRKRKIYNAISPTQLHFVTPSRWLAQEAKSSSLLERFPVSIIPYGVETDIFYPRDRKVGREALEVPQHARVLLFVSHSVENHRKGFSMLAEALGGLHENNKLLLLSLGTGTLELKGRIPHLHLGHIENDRLLALIYSVADIFVIPSLQDNLPNTALESMACGTPVIGFEVGGIPDMVRPGVTGILTPPGNSTALRDSILDLLNNPHVLKEMSLNCRRIAEAEYSLETQARRYVELYNKIVTS